ncbi:MAG TPA: toll/interleukin-1 receptor domain-containing protein, partial [Pyrinomonadaceae bacterium]
MKIFLSWSGETSHEVAKALKSWLNNLLPALDMWISDELPGGRRWSLELAQNLEQTDTGIVILTKESLASPWVYFECGALSKTMRQSRVFPYLFDLDTSDYSENPLQEFQARGADKEGTQKLLADLNRDLPQPLPAQSLNFLFERTWPDLEGEFRRIREESGGENEILEGKAKFDEMFSRIKKADLLQDNQYLRRVVVKSVKEFSGGLQPLLSSDKSYSLPYILYPSYLTGLLRVLQPITQAIAIVDNDEPFWNQKEGRKILELTQQQSTRVFAFYDHAHLQNYLHTIQNHARKYDVFVIDYDLLPPFYSAKPYDFSIIGDINSSSLLAVYDEEESPMKRIKFTADTGAISRHHDRFKAILDASVKVPRDFNSEEKGDWLVAEAFPADRAKKLTQLQQRHIEMSSYIHPQEYHLHEEKHAYYLPMMERMLAICEAHHLSRRGQGRRMRALEMGA